LDVNRAPVSAKRPAANQSDRIESHIHTMFLRHGRESSNVLSQWQQALLIALLELMPLRRVSQHGPT
jgi:hypothetical protein